MGLVLVISIVIAVVMAGLLYRLFFKDFADFIECLRFYFQPDLISVFRGELIEDWWGSTKIAVWLILSLGMGAVSLYKLPQILPGLKEKTVAKMNAIRAGAHRPGASGTHEGSDALIPADARQYGVTIGDTVEISALNPAIALRRAKVVTMNQEQLTVRSGSDDYSIRWDNLTKLKRSN